MLKKNSIPFFILCVLFASSGFSQSILFPQDYFFEQYKNQKNYTSFSKDTTYHTSIFPVINQNSISYDSINYYKDGRIWFYKKLLQDNFISLNKKDTIAGEVNDFKLTIDPILNLNIGKSNSLDKTINTYTNTRGIIANLQINKRFKLETAFIENQSIFPTYISNQVKNSLDVLGQGRWKQFKTDGYDYAMSSGVIWWKASKNIEIYAGHGKQKIGNGYRSFFISDQAFNYPYARVDFTFDKIKIKYTAAYALLMNLKPTVNITINRPEGTEALMQKKPFSFQYLSYQPSKYFSLALFQGIVWNSSDERNKIDISANYLNPLIFSNLASYGFNAKPKIVTGFEGNLKITKISHFYFQAATDGMKDTSKKTQSYGLQLGLKLFNAFTLKNLFLQLEYNEYDGYLFQKNSTSGSTSIYTHYEQSLSFNTTSKNGQELIAIAAYKYKRFMLTTKASYKPEITLEKSTLHGEGKLSFILQPKTNMNISLGYVYRNIQNNNSGMLATPVNNNLAPTQWIYFSFVTSLFNTYYDF